MTTITHKLPTAVQAGHIPGTSRRDLPGSDENRRDLSRKSDLMRGAFALLRDTPAQDPAYRPTCQAGNVQRLIWAELLTAGLSFVRVCNPQALATH